MITFLHWRSYTVSSRHPSPLPVLPTPPRVYFVAFYHRHCEDLFFPPASSYFTSLQAELTRTSLHLSIFTHPSFPCHIRVSFTEISHTFRTVREGCISRAYVLAEASVYDDALLPLSSLHFQPKKAPHSIPRITAHILLTGSSIAGPDPQARSVR